MSSGNNCGNEPLIDIAYAIAYDMLASVLPRRWSHVEAVARKAATISSILPEPDRPILVAAAWLHDVGYAPALVDSGLHALDGARWLRSQPIDERAISLVAYHSCALFEAEERGLADQLLGEFTDEESPTRDAVWYVDMTTGPDGQYMSAQERLAEIRQRYGPDDPVTRFWSRAEPTLMDAINRTEVRMSAADIQPM
jgi:hypothetical protein